MPENSFPDFFLASWFLLGSDNVAEALTGDWKGAGREKPKPYTFWGEEEGRALSGVFSSSGKG